MSNISVVYSLSDEEFVNLIDRNFTYSDILRELRLCTSGSASRTVLKRRIAELDLDVSHFNSSINNVANNKSIPIEEILVENSNYTSIYNLKKRLLKLDLIKNICYICKITNIWNGQPLTLQLDHINGNNRDHRLVNLRMLCPNCHSQTHTFAGRNINKQV